MLISEVSGWCAGPLFVKTNDVLRNKGKTKGGNNYSNVIHAIVSGITKLSQVSGIPDNRTLFRGTGGMRLSDGFYVEDETGVRGGVERALLSTTTARAVAMHYIDGRDLPTVCCIQVSAVSKGASLSHISQFPGEDEVLMPPGSFLEVVGRPRVVQLENGKSVLEIPMQISCPKTATIEQTRASRKTSLLSMVDHLLLEVRETLSIILVSFPSSLSYHTHIRITLFEASCFLISCFEHLQYGISQMYTFSYCLHNVLISYAGIFLTWHSLHQLLTLAGSVSYLLISLLVDVLYLREQFLK